MIRFINLNNGNVYNGDNYIHYFDNELSINIIYTHKICLITNEFDTIDVSMEKNSIFSFVDAEKLLNSPNLNFDNYYCYNLNIKPSAILKNNYKVFVIYFKGSSNIPGEFILNFLVNGYIYKIGADFYGENELLKINLSNFGIELPNEIQKAIYTTNVHEDKDDWILLNRKFKELLSNYWDIIANKGSYKSFENSLKWFEYGDLVKLKEIWKDPTGRFYETDWNTTIQDKYESFLLSYYKTSSVSLGLAINEISKENDEPIYDEEYNPVLKELSYEITYDDLLLKMELLGNFLLTYFAPIHINIIRSTVENLTFSNAIKIINSNSILSNDEFCNFELVNCNIKDGDEFILKNIKINILPDTKLSTRNNLPSFEYYDLNDQSTLKHTYKNTASYTLGIDAIRDYNDNYTIEDSKLYLATNYSGPGVMINIIYEIILEQDDFIKNEIFTYLPDNAIDKQWKTEMVQEIFYGDITQDQYKTIKIPLNILCIEQRPYEIRAQFETASGKIYTKNIKFNVLFNNNEELKLYKICHKNYDSRYGFSKFERTNINEIEIGTIRDKNNKLLKYSLFINHDKYQPGYDGVCLNNILVIKGDINYGTTDIDWIKYIDNNYFVFFKNVLDELDKEINTDNPTDKLVHTKQEEKNKQTYTKLGKLKPMGVYTICISKKFDFIPNIPSELKSKIYRNDYGYFPEFHELKPFGVSKTDINDYIITDKDTLCVVPRFSYTWEIPLNGWIFENISSGEQIRPTISIKDPIISNNEKLTPGYYNIIYQYSLQNNYNYKLIKLNSAFIKQ